MSIRRIRKAVREGRYELTGHALEEMDDDGLDLSEVRGALLHGVIAATLTDDPRGARYVVRALLKDDRKVEIVGRFLPSGVLRIVTVYILRS